MKQNQRDKFRLWFSFLKIAQNDPPFLRSAIDWTRYEPWGPIQKYSSFEKWWKDYGQKLQNPVVREVQRIPDVPPPNTIYLEVPLNRAPQRLAARARHIIQARLEKTYQERVRTKGEKRPTFKRGFYGSAWFTEGREIHLDYHRNLLDLYAAVFKQHPGPVGMKTLAALNEVGAKNVTKNAENAKRGIKREVNAFRLYTTYDQTNEELAKVEVRRRLEPYTQWKKRERQEKDAGIAAGDPDARSWKVPRKYLPFVLDGKELTSDEFKRLDYQNNPGAHSAIQNLRRAKDALRIVVNAVARGEFPGPKAR